MTLVTKPKRNSQHHKKRSGKHHRHTDHYAKTYWPYLPMLLVVAFGFFVNGLWSHAGVLGTTSNFSSNALLTDTNQQRTTDHEAPLEVNQELSAAAQAKANDMVQKDYWAHVSPSGQTPWQFINGAGYSYSAAGENLAYGFANANDTLAGWMNSPTHRANILNADYKDVGFGVASSPNFQGHGPATIVVAEYAAPAEALPVTSASNSPASADLTTTAKPVSRIQVLTGQQAWITAAVSALAGAAVAVFLVRHGLRFKRLILEGEQLVLHHPMLDIAIVFVGTMSIIFAQASGTIR